VILLPNMGLVTKLLNLITGGGTTQEERVRRQEKKKQQMELRRDVKRFHELSNKQGKTAQARLLSLVAQYGITDRKILSDPERLKKEFIKRHGRELEKRMQQYDQAAE
jgi:hypothetical protein